MHSVKHTKNNIMKKDAIVLEPESCKTNVTMVFVPVINYTNVSRNTFRDFLFSNEEEIKSVITILQPIKQHLILKDWGVHDVDTVGDIIVPQMDAELFNDFDDDWEDVVEEEELESFAKTLEMDLEDFKVWMKKYWAVAIPLSIADLKSKLEL